MTLQELIKSVDAKKYEESPLFQQLRKVKPEYGSNRRIVVKQQNGEVVISNSHIGSLGDIITYPIDVAPELQVSKSQLLDAILHEMSANGYDDGEQSDFWNDMTNLQKAKIVR